MIVYDLINERIKVDRQSGQTIYLDQATGQRMSDKSLDKLREDFPTLDEFVKKYEQSTGRKVLAIIPNGNLLANEWFVGFKDGEVYHRLDKPVNKRRYTFLVAYTGGDINIEEHTVDELRSKAENIIFATSGQPLVKNGEAVPLVDVVSQFEDLRHLFTFPRIKWEIIKNLGFEISGQLSGSFYFGANYMVGKEDLLTTAAEGKVLGLPIREVFLEILKRHDSNAVQKFSDECYEELKEELKKGLYKAGYVEVESKNVQGLVWGEYKIEGDSLYIRLKEGMYPHTAIGIRRDGQVVLYAINGKSGRLGITIAELQKLLLADGVQDAILIANGGDALLRVLREGEFKDVIPSPEKRKNFTSVILVVGE